MKRIFAIALCLSLLVTLCLPTLVGATDIANQYLAEYDYTVSVDEIYGSVEQYVGNIEDIEIPNVDGLTVEHNSAMSATATNAASEASNSKTTTILLVAILELLIFGSGIAIGVLLGRKKQQ